MIHVDYLYPNGVKDAEYIRLDKNDKANAKATNKIGKLLEKTRYILKMLRKLT